MRVVGRARGVGVKPPCAASPRQWAASSRRVNIVLLRVSRKQSCHVLLRAALLSPDRFAWYYYLVTILYFAEYCEQVHRCVVQLACSRDRPKNWIEACWNSNRGKLHRITVACTLSSFSSSSVRSFWFIAYHRIFRLTRLSRLLYRVFIRPPFATRIYYLPSFFAYCRVERLRGKKSKYRFLGIFFSRVPTLLR